MFAKAYLEITNQCNLNCSFCPKTRRKPGRLTVETFTHLAEKIRPHTEFLYLHVMGEPLCHPHLLTFLQVAGDLGFRVILTTNGTLLPQVGEGLLQAKALHKINLSLHAFEANDGVDMDKYLDGCLDFAQKSRETGLLCSLRLWNLGEGLHRENDHILEKLETYFPKAWAENTKGYRLANRLFLEWGEKFQWPDLSAEDLGESCFCYGLRDQVAVHWDGTVVPCCLDHEGDIPLGNLFETTLEEILQGDRARNLYQGFSGRKAVEPLCRRCGYARKFDKR